MDTILLFWQVFCTFLINSNVNGGLVDNRQKRSHHSEATDDEEHVIIETVNGKIRGNIFPAVGKDGKVAEFLGIPYAEKPIGAHRFTDAVPKEPWENTLDAFHHGSPCEQPLDDIFGDFEGANMWNPQIPTSEDCLYLDIWVPYPLPKNSSVMVWIYGGGFYSGTSSLWQYHGEILAGFTDVIVVSFNYRLGAFGFLSSGDDRIKGNFGLKDQSLALKWVKNNIAQFGGNPNSVTLFGESCGASSIGYHLISHWSDNLFQRAIMQSGSPNSHYAFASNDLVQFRFKNFISYVNCPDDANVVTCLQQVPANELNKYVNESWANTKRLQGAFLPVIDGDFIKEDPSYSIDKNNFKQVPILLSVNKNEGTVFLIYYYSKHFHLKGDSCISRHEFEEITDDLCKDLSPNTREFIKYLYTDWTDSTSPTKNRDALDELLGDREFKCPIHHLAEKMRTTNSDVYFAEFNYRASNEVWPEWLGVYHGEEIQFVFGHPFNVSRGYSDKDRMVSQNVMTYWSNFAKFGNPNGDPSKASSPDVSTKWPALHHQHKHLEITDELKISQHFEDDQCQFWNAVVPALSHLSCSTN